MNEILKSKEKHAVTYFEHDGTSVDHGHAEPPAQPMRTVRFFTPGTIALLVLAGIGALVGLRRFLFGIGSVSNLDTDHPWGIWIALDVASGVALAAGGFTTSALAHIFHRERYHAIVRPALLTAMLGYTFVGLGLMFDLGRYYNIWHPMIMWQGNSVLFEVGMCVMAYLTVLYIEFLPIVVERFKDGVRLPGPLRLFNGLAHGVLRLSGRVLDKVLFVFIIAGVVLSCLHQSSLGALMLIAPAKVHPLWFTPVLPLMFLLSAISVGYPMVILESMTAARSFRLNPEMEILTPLARITPIILGLYLALKAVDMALRGTYVYLADGSTASMCFLAEILLGVVLPLGLLLFERVRRSPGMLLTAASLVVGGVVLNRVNVFLVSYRPPYSNGPYYPALGEIAITAALVATLILVYRFVVMNFPVIAGRPKVPLGKAVLPVALILLSLSFLGCEAEEEKRARAEEEAEMHVCPICPVCSAAPAGKTDNGRRLLTPEDGPKVSMLSHLADQYVPVKFNHKDHAVVAGNCEVCHHYHSEVEQTPSCRECHGLPFKNLRKPGLKGAYHRQCMFCHRTLAKGPLTCEGCHHKRAPGAAEPPVDAYGPTEVLLGHLASEYPPVKFNHKLHAEMADDCKECHHHHGEVEKTPPCRECHNTLKTAPGDKKLGLKAAYHKQCLGCHREQHGPEDCSGCHNGKTEEKEEEKPK